MNDLANIFNQKGARTNVTDSSETVIISTIALIKMFKHAARGIPVEVMGICIGRFIDEYTVYVQDVFAMPQVGMSDSVETIDEVFQKEMLDMLEHVGVQEKAVGWFHSHPSYYCWLSSVDLAQQATFEKMDPRCVAIVVDPINSANGRLIIESFRIIQDGLAVPFARAVETRVVTAETGFLRKKEIKSVQHGMGSSFYQMPLQFNQLGYERCMTAKLGAKLWVRFLQEGEQLEPEKELAKLRGEKRSEESSLLNLHFAQSPEEAFGTVPLRPATSVAALIQLVRDRDLLGCEEAASKLITAGLQGDVDDVVRATVFQ